jgi:hypothetical protein
MRSTRREIVQRDALSFMKPTPAIYFVSDHVAGYFVCARLAMWSETVTLI